jgi:hypothetical protein
VLKLRAVPVFDGCDRLFSFSLPDAVLADVQVYDERERTPIVFFHFGADGLVQLRGDRLSSFDPVLYGIILHPSFKSILCAQVAARKKGGGNLDL